MQTTNLTEMRLSTVCAVTMIPGPAFAVPIQHYPFQDVGRILSIEPQFGMFIMQNRHEATVAVRWNHNTRFIEHGKPILSTDLKPGEYVSIAYTEEGGQLAARTVRVSPHRAVVRKLS